MIAGVCGGLGEYFNYDPAWIRLLFILFLLVGGSAILVYLGRIQPISATAYFLKN
jgi:phage shock protein C